MAALELPQHLTTCCRGIWVVLRQGWPGTVAQTGHTCLLSLRPHPLPRKWPREGGAMQCLPGMRSMQCAEVVAVGVCVVGYGGSVPPFRVHPIC